MSKLDTEREEERSNSSRVYLREVIGEFAAELPKGARVLDAGGGPGRYGSLFAEQIYEIADLRPGSTYVCDIHALPIPDETFEAALSTQALYLMKEPKIVLSELHRVLKPGGPILLTAPFIYEYGPIGRDFFRFTSAGFSHLCETTGFHITKITWLEGFFGTLGYLLRTASEQLSRLHTQEYSPVDRRIVHKGEIDLALLGQAFNEMDLRYKEMSVGFPLNYVVRAYRV
jgi:SAM-dependent methyltransferase